MFLDYFDVLVSKIIFFLNIILIYFWVKNILKNNYYHTFKYIVKDEFKQSALISWCQRVSSFLALPKVLFYSHCRKTPSRQGF
jgi:hypothetical protein